MNTEATKGNVDLSFLQERIRELEKTVEKLEKSPFSGLPWWRRTAGICLFVFVVFGSTYGAMGQFGRGPTFLDVHKLEAYSVEAVQIDFQDPNEDEAYWGKINGRRSDINLHSEEGSVRIDPTGIRIEGPDGVLILKPEKK